MATTTGTNAAREAFFYGRLNFSTDTMTMALYNGSGHSATVTQYSVTSEVVGTGYTAKGVALSGVSIVKDDANNAAYVDWTTDPSWSGSTITSTDCLIYADNLTTPVADLAVYVGDFAGSKSTSSGLFEVKFPAAAYNTAILRFV